MSGSLCPVHDVKESKAYCEGRVASANGLLITTNPHIADAVAEARWDAGFNSWVADPAGIDPVNANCCGRAYSYGGGYVAP